MISAFGSAGAWAASVRRVLARGPTVLVAMGMRVLSMGLAFVIGVVLARGLGPEGFGQYSVVIAWILLGVAIAEAGAPQVLVREISAYRAVGENELAAGIIRTGQIFVICTALVIVPGLLVLDQFGSLGKVDALLLYLGLPLLAIRSLDAVLQSSTRGLGRVLRGQASELVVRPGVQLTLLLVLAAGVLPVALAPVSAIGIYLAACVAGLVYSAVTLTQARSILGTRRRQRELGPWLSSTWKIGLYTWLTALNAQSSLIILGALSTAAESADFRVALQNAALVPVGLNVMNAIQAPAVSAAFRRGDREELQRLVSRNCAVSLATSAPIGLLFIIWGGGFVQLLFGEQYAGAAPALAALAIGQLVNAGVGPVGLLMVASRNERRLLITQTGLVAANVALSVALVPEFGALGAAIASATALILLNLLLLWQVRKELGIWSLPVVATSRAPGGHNTSISSASVGTAPVPDPTGSSDGDNR